MPTPRNHHFVPQFLLRYFSIGGNERQVYAFDKSDGRDFPLSVRNAAAENAFYEVEINGQTLNFESAFQAIDDLGGEILGALAAAAGPIVLDSRTLAALPSLATAQLLRTKLQRTTPQALTRQLREQSEAAGLDIEAEITDEEARRISLLQLMHGAEMEGSFRSKDVLLLEADGGLHFWISDNPVVMHNTFPYGNVGLSAPGIEIYFPLSPSRALAFFCPSIGRQIAESLDPAHPRRRLENPMYPEMLRAIGNHSTLRVSNDYVAFLNELQVQQSTRFLYSDRNQFDLARAVLERRPELSSVQSLFTVGEMGAAPPPSPAMPPGQWLVVESGTNHHAIPVTTLEGGSAAYIEFEPLDYTKLTVALQDAPFDSATLYLNGSQIRVMREVEFELLMRDDRRIVRVRHSDPGVRHFMEQLTSNGGSADQPTPSL